MMNTFKKLIVLSSLLIGAQAQAYTVDGDISDWGVTNTGNASDWTPNAGVSWAVSDEGSWGLAPGLAGGGQPYDAEAIYLDYDSTYLYYAVVTGRPEITSQYKSGDIAFDFGNNGTSELGIETRGNNGFNKGDLVQVVNWSDPQIASNLSAGVVEIVNGTVQASSTDFVYSATPTQDIGQFTSSSYDDHYVMEGKIALTEFALYQGQNFTVHWTMGCGNDEIHLNSDFTVPGTETGVPLPGTSLLFGGALVGMIGMRRRQQKLATSASEEEEAKS